MKKVRNFILFACAVLVLQMQVVYSKNEKPGKNVSQETIEKIKAEDKNLATLLDNALFLVNQIKDNDHDEENRKKAIKNIDDTIKKLSSDIKNKINNDITVIKEESASFATHRKPLQKYYSNPAQQALERMTSEIKKIAEDRSENVVVQAQQVLVKTISKTEIIEKEATIAINKAQGQLKAGLISPIEAAKIIGEQTYRIDAAKRVLNKEAKNAAEKVTQSDMQAGYLSQFSTSVYNLGARALAPLKAGYGYTEEEKEIARAIIIELEKQLELIKQQYKKELMQPLYKNPQKFAAMKKDFELQIQHVSNALYEQKIITGEVMSTNRKLFWGAVAAAGAITAGVLGYQYFVTPAELLQIPGSTPPSTEQVPVVSETEDIQETKQRELAEEYAQGLTGWEQGEEQAPVAKPKTEKPVELLLPGEEEEHSWFAARQQPEEPKEEIITPAIAAPTILEEIVQQQPEVIKEEPIEEKSVEMSTEPETEEISEVTTEEPAEGAAVETEEGLTEDVVTPEEMPEMTEREEKAPEAMSTGEPEEGTVETAVTELEQTPEVPEEVVAEEEPAVVTEPTVSTEEEISTETTPEKTPEELAERREAEERLNASIRPVVFPPKAEKGLKEIIGKAEQLSAESLQNPAADLEGTQPEEILGEPEANQQTEPTKAQTEEQVGI